MQDNPFNALTEEEVEVSEKIWKLISDNVEVTTPTGVIILLAEAIGAIVRIAYGKDDMDTIYKLISRCVRSGYEGVERIEREMDDVPPSRH